MTSRRGILSGLVAIVGGSLLDADLSEDDLDELQAELYANENGPTDKSVLDVDGRGFMSLDADPVFIESGASCGASVLFYDWDDAVGLGVEAEEDGTTASTSVSLSLEEAREVRNRLDATIALVESELDHLERRDGNNK